MEAALYSDALDDLHGVDLFAPEPKPAVVAPPIPSLAWREYTAKWADRCALLSCDLEFLRIVEPAAYVLCGQLAHAFTKGVTLSAPYRHVEGARNALRCTLHQTEVI